MLEYFTGWLMETLFKTTWWDYSHRKFNIKGRVCLRNSLLFGLMGMAMVYFLHPLVMDVINNLGGKTQRLLSGALLAILLFDLLRTVATLTHMEEKMVLAKDVLKDLEAYQKQYHWFNRKDIKGSRLQLHKVALAAEDSEQKQRILAYLDKTEKQQGKITNLTRMVKAYPGMKLKELNEEFTVVKKALIAKGEKQKGFFQNLWEKTKAKGKKAWQDIKESYQGVNLVQMIWVFIIGSVVGFVVETLWCLVTRGMIESRQGLVYGPFSQVYGMGAVIMVLLLSPFAKKGDGWLFFAGAFVGGFYEAVCSLMQEIAFGSVSWEYGEFPFSLLGGRTHLLYMCFWGILTIVYMKTIYPAMARLIEKAPKRPKLFFTWVMVVLLVLDMGISALAVGRWSQRIKGIPAENPVAHWTDEHYPDEMMEEIYPNMVFTHEALKEEKALPQGE